MPGCGLRSTTGRNGCGSEPMPSDRNGGSLCCLFAHASGRFTQPSRSPAGTEPGRWAS